jgi:hypothetical protein
MHNLKIITSTTRPGRKGLAIANWITGLAELKRWSETLKLMRQSK